MKSLKEIELWQALFALGSSAGKRAGLKSPAIRNDKEIWL